jgi:hypothetical protein
MVAAEECIPAKNYVLSIYPVFVRASTVLVHQSIFQSNVSTPLSQCIWRYGSVIRKQIITPLGSKCTGKAHERHLDRCWTSSKDLVPRSSCISIEIDKDMNAILDDLIDELFRWPAASVMKHGGFSFDLPAMFR